MRKQKNYRRESLVPRLATPMNKLLIRIIIGFTANYDYLSTKFCILTIRMTNTMLVIIFQIYTSFIRMLIKVLSTISFYLLSLWCIFILWLSLLFGGLTFAVEFIEKYLGSGFQLILIIHNPNNLEILYL